MDEIIAPQRKTIRPTDFTHLIQEQSNKAVFWKSCHFDTSRYFRKIDNLIGLPSVILATAILGFAFYSVGRENTPLWAQLLLATFSVLQGILVSIQLYLKPAFLAENHKNTANELGKLQRKWELLQVRAVSGDNISLGEIEELMRIQDDIGEAAEPFPQSIIKQNKAKK